MKQKMKQKTILLGEDDNDLAQMYKIAFENEGFRVVLAFDGEEVVMKSKLENPDIILLDINMPKKNGFEVLKEACSDIALYRVLKKTPIIMLSNYSNQQDIDYCMKNGAQDFLIKSEWTPEAVIKKVKEYLEEK